MLIDYIDLGLDGRVPSLPVRGFGIRRNVMSIYYNRSLSGREKNKNLKATF